MREVRLKAMGHRTFHFIKEGVLLRNVSPSLVLCDHVPGGGILELQTGPGDWVKLGMAIYCMFFF